LVNTYYTKYNIPPEDIENERIAWAIFRNDKDIMEHQRDVTNIYDFLGAIAGIYELTIYIF